MLTLVYDTETNGFPSFKLDADSPGQAHLVELGMLLVDSTSGKILKTSRQLVNENFEISEKLTAIHGITKQMCKANGEYLFAVVQKFKSWALTADRVVSHNAKFDLKMMQISLLNANCSFTPISKLDHFCTMLTARRVLGFAKLESVYKSLVDPNGFESAHTAVADATACAKVMFALESAGHKLTPYRT